MPLASAPVALYPGFESEMPSIVPLSLCSDCNHKIDICKYRFCFENAIQYSGKKIWVQILPVWV